MSVVTVTLQNLSCSQLNSSSWVHSFKNQTVYWETCASSTSIQASNTYNTQNVISMNCAHSNYPLIFKSKRGILNITFILEEPNKLNTLTQSHISITALLGL